MRWLLTYPEDGPSVSYYQHWVRAAGIEPVLMDAQYQNPGDLASFAALLLPGGGDVDPALYGEVERHPMTYDVIPERDALEIKLIAEFRARRLPVFGICRGIQILNVALGGGLIQHVPDVVPETLEPHRREDFYDARHPLTVSPTSPLGSALKSATECNSAHHQAIIPSRIGNGLQVVAWSGAGVVEAVESIDGRLSAVQWHPERLPLDHPASIGLRAWWAALSANPTRNLM